MMRGRVIWVDSVSENLNVVAFHSEINCAMCPDRVECLMTEENRENNRDSRFFRCQVRCEVQLDGSVLAVFRTRLDSSRVTFYSLGKLKELTGYNACEAYDRLYKRRD